MYLATGLTGLGRCFVVVALDKLHGTALLVKLIGVNDN